MKKLVFAFLLLVAAGGGAYYYFVYDKPVEKPTVNRAPITRGDILEVVQSTGSLEPTRIVQVGSQVSGVVKELYVDFNSIVHVGQVVAEIDPKLLQVQVEIQNANIAQREGDIANQRVQLEQDRKNLERTRQQVEKQIMNVQQLEQAELTVRNREAQISSAEKGLLSLKANLDQAKMNVDYTVIKSPVEGVVVNRLVDKGQTVQASLNTPQFFTIATDLRELKLSAGVDEAEIGKVEAGQRVLFKVDAYADQEFEGVVDTVRLNASTQNNVVTYPVWIKVLNPQLRLKPSMTANLRIIISTASNVLRVPNGALRWKPNNEIYTALGLTPPAAGRTLNPINETSNGGGKAPGAPGAPATDGKGTDGKGAAPQMASNGQNGRGGQGGGQTPGGRGGSNRQPSTGFGNGAMANLTPEQRQAMMSRFGGPGQAGQAGQTGTSRRGQGGRGGGGGRGNAAPGANLTEPKKELDAQKIDELFEPIPHREMPGTVYTWDEAKKELKEHKIRVGVTDGSFSEIVRGDTLEEKTMVVTGVVLPQTQQNRGGNNLFGQPNMRGMGGMTPSGPGGGGGNPGGGGGGGGRGGGGRGGGD